MWFPIWRGTERTVAARVKGGKLPVKPIGGRAQAPPTARASCHSKTCDDLLVKLDDISRLAQQLEGVSESRRDGLLNWRYHGRLVARQLDDSHIVIRSSFEFRDFLLQAFPETFSVPRRWAKHMMLVADLERGSADAVEDAVIGAWELQSGK